MSHTTGPWIPRYQFKTVPRNEGHDIREISVVHYDKRKPAEYICRKVLTEDDACLIAAAPDLLDALYSILNVETVAMYGNAAMKSELRLNVKYHFDKVRQALAKAGGRELCSL